MAWEHGNHARGGLGKDGASFFYVKSFLGRKLRPFWGLVSFFFVCVCGGRRGGGFSFFERWIIYYIFFLFSSFHVGFRFVFTDAFTSPLAYIKYGGTKTGVEGGESI